MIIIDNNKTKTVVSPDYNYIFNKGTGFFARWGKTKKDDPQVAPAPEIADIEITTKCNGGCKHCYKSNTRNGTNMSFKTFKELFDKLPKTITQIAFGADADLTMNPDIWDIMLYTRDNGVIPNITIAKADDDTADKLAGICGAVAVSRYDNKDQCYDTVKRLTDRGMDQVNIHQLVSKETFINCMYTINDYHVDGRLVKLNAIVFLSLKRKGRGNEYNYAELKDWEHMIKFADKLKTPYGFDSCSVPIVEKVFKKMGLWEKYETVVEPCESTCFSSYFDVAGNFFPCSFCERVKGWETGINFKDVETFDEIWKDGRTELFRKILLEGNRRCPIYDIYKGDK